MENAEAAAAPVRVAAVQSGRNPAVAAAHLHPRIAYFSMEIALASEIPTYSGGLGVLAGDVLLSAADLGLPVVGVSMVHREGYFVQELDAEGVQREHPDRWDPAARLRAVDATVELELEGRRVRIGAWRFDLVGRGGALVPVFLLDTDLEGNDPRDRALVGSLYGGDARYRLAQETILGYGGAALLERLGLADGISTYHLNEGHSALLIAALLERRLAAAGSAEPSDADLAAIRTHFAFTTHTPVPAGHDRFERSLAEALLGPRRLHLLERLGALDDGHVNMSRLALAGSRYTNGVAMRHGEVSRALFGDARIGAITNGVHHVRWTAPALAALLDRRLPRWREDAAYLRHAIGLPLDELGAAHRSAKERLFTTIAVRGGPRLDPDRLTLGFARRAAAYKRGALVFSDLERLRAVAEREGPLQFVFGGKAHPQDADGKAVIARIFAAARALGPAVSVVYLANYEMALAAQIVAGVDLWLSTPRPPLEASGTSGMKAALNGVPSLSTLDGWWVEGCVEGVTGWAIGEGRGDLPDEADAAALYARLAEIVPLFYREIERFAWIARNAIALNGSYFNTQRMVEQYALAAYA
ncbi:MAG: alpha-glucan family phosphorylase [Vulcanimicrobiaceae bacterium]